MFCNRWVNKKINPEWHFDLCFMMFTDYFPSYFTTREMWKYLQVKEWKPSQSPLFWIVSATLFKSLTSDPHTARPLRLNINRYSALCTLIGQEDWLGSAPVCGVSGRFSRVAAQIFVPKLYFCARPLKSVSDSGVPASGMRVHASPGAHALIGNWLRFRVRGWGRLWWVNVKSL